MNHARLLVLLPLLGPLQAQQLRQAVASSDLVVVGTDVSVRPLGQAFLAHQVRVAKSLKGEPGEQVVVLEQKGVSRHAQPAPGEARIWCLLDFTAEAARLGLPDSLGHYYKLAGHEGSHPKLGTDVDRDPAVELARVVVAADRGLDLMQVADKTVALALRAGPEMRTEAVKVLTERPSLRGKLTEIQKSDLMARAVGELDDVQLKIALAELCAEMKMPRLVEQLCLSIDRVEDRRFCESLGRIARVLHGERAHEALVPALRQSRSPETRSRLYLALGATSTPGALELLLEAARSQEQRDMWLDAALELHGAKEAKEALAKRADSRPASGSVRR
jgi:hypothetical protein